MDGTLYSFDNDTSKSFGESTFYRDLKKRMTSFVMDRYELDIPDAEALIARINTEYEGEISIGFEKEKGLSRYEYFAGTWDVDPSQYIVANPRLREVMSPLAKRAVLLTAAPRVWADRVISYLDLGDVFGDRVISGEPDMRKPNPAVFLQGASLLGVSASQVVSIGDQVYSDIIPARTVGMRTALVGSVSSEADMSFKTVIDAIQNLEQTQCDV